MTPKIIPYNPKLKEFSKHLRNNSTLSEVLLWNELKSKKMRGYSFNRQKPLDEYIVDFYCKELKLVIEIDGFSHDFKVENDINRQERLESYGLSFLRFSDRDVKTDLKNVLRVIENWIAENERSQNVTSPWPPSKGDLGI